MDGNKRKFFKKHQNTQFKRKGVNKKGKWGNSSLEPSHGNSPPADTVYHILCPSRKIGAVIGKGGSVIKALREETQAKITVADPAQGSDERVIIIYSSSEKKIMNNDGDAIVQNEQVPFEPHCAAQYALLRIHDLIVKEDLFGGIGSENNAVTARLLVPNNMVGCILGKGGDVIQRLRSETGASIRVLPADHLPSCATGTDELVQISGKPDLAKRALFEISTCLHMNPRKDKPPTLPLPYGDQSFHLTGGPLTSKLPLENPMWSPHVLLRKPNPMLWGSEVYNQPSAFGPGSFNGVPTGYGVKPAAEFSMKILCSAGKIGGVIGKGGSTVKLVQQETGASIHVEYASTESDEQAIRVSALETLCDPISQTIEAILQLQSKTSEFFEKGTITTRLLVPSSKVGCILGQAGYVINEMRRRTRADIRVLSKDDKPSCASEDEELVQISGNFGVAKDALAEIASRLRARILRDANEAAEVRTGGFAKVYMPERNFSERIPPPSMAMASRRSRGFESFKGGRHDYEPQNYSISPPATRYSKASSMLILESYDPNNDVNTTRETRGGDISNFGEGTRARMKLQDAEFGASESMVEVHGLSDHLPAAQDTHQRYMFFSTEHGPNPHQVCYQSINSHQSSYLNTDVQQRIRAHQSPYESMTRPQSPYAGTAQRGFYSHINVLQGAYHHISPQQEHHAYSLLD